MELNRYRTLPSGLQQRIYPKNETYNERQERLMDERAERRRLPTTSSANYYRRRLTQNVIDGVVQIDREPGDEDRGSYDYRIRLLQRGVKNLNYLQPRPEQDYIWY